MEYKLEWINEEEGTITFWDKKKTPVLSVRFFATGEEEAEFQLQDVVFSKDSPKSDNIQDKVVSKVINCILKSFRLLWEEGFEEVVFVGKKGSEVVEILDSTDVVYLAYSEFMMKRRFELKKSTACGHISIKLTKTKDGYCCENADKSFFCRLLTYTAEDAEENCFYLYEAEVNEKKRNNGIATACLTELFRLLAAEAPVTVFLQVGSYNEPAVHLYKKLGFEISEELCYYAAQE